MDKMIRWGFLGCGKVVQKKSGEAFRTVPNSTISETMRILISNGIILYALTKSGGNSRG